jgi:hypothetical protein
VTLKRIYLDQRDWIALARQHYGKTNSPEMADLLALVREASATGQASFPLSATHYVETFHSRNPGRRQRLGEFMATISRFHAIASCTDLLTPEVHVAVCAVAGRTSLVQPKPFGQGAQHAFGKDAPSYFQDPALQRLATATLGSERVFEYFESALIRGPDEALPANGIALPTREFGQRQLDFERGTAKRLRAWGHSSDRAHRTVLAQEAKDILPIIEEVTANLGVDLWSFVDDQDALTAFILSMPAKGAICRMRMSAHEDQNFRWHINDLNDITALGTAVGYCDVVVAENHWGNILRRHSPYLQAVVTSDLLDLRDFLVS